MKKKQIIRFLSLCLIVIFCLSTTVSAAAPEYSEPMSSEQLRTYSAYIVPSGSGNLVIRYNVYGKDIMDAVGCQRIRLYESLDGANWYFVAEFTPTSYSNMMAYGARELISSVPYSGVAGRYYKAFVTVTATNSSGTDTRSFWTAVVRAT